MQKLQNILLAISKGEYKKTTDEILKFFGTLVSKYELGYFIELATSQSFLNIADKLEKEDLQKIAIALKDKYFEIILKKGDIAENNHIKLFLFFRKLEMSNDEKFIPYLEFISKNYLSDGLEDSERVYLANLRFVINFMNFEPNLAYKEFIKDYLILHLHKLHTIKIETFLVDFLEILKIPIDVTLEGISELLEPAKYFSYNQTQRRSIFNWSFHLLWNIKLYYNEQRWTSLYPLWKKLFYTHLDRGEIDEAMYLHFYIYHKMGNSFQTQDEWKWFCDEIDKVASGYYKIWGEQNGLIKPKDSISSGKKLIGVLQDRIVKNSPFKVQYSLFKSLMEDSRFRDNYEIKIYIMSYFEKSVNDNEAISDLEKLGIEVKDCAKPFYVDYYYHSHLQKAIFIREQIIKDGVDILISPNNGYDISDFVIANRCAPKQIFWSHGNFVYDIEGIDEKITHIQEKNVGFKCFEIDMAKDFFESKISKSAIESERAKYPRDCFILGVIGRLVKVDNDEYLSCVADILKQNPNTIYIAAGTGNIDSIKEKIKKLGVSERFYFPGYVDARLYGEIIDMWLNTFPLVQGESFNEFLYLRKPFVSMVVATPEWIEKYKDSPRRFLYPDNKEKYIDFATKIIQDKELSSKAVEIIYKELDEYQKSVKNSFVEVLKI